MKRAARFVVALALVAFAGPVLACGFDKPHTTTTSAPTEPATVVKAEKAKGTTAKKVEKAKAPAAQKSVARN